MPRHSHVLLYRQRDHCGRIWSDVSLSVRDRDRPHCSNGHVPAPGRKEDHKPWKDVYSLIHELHSPCPCLNLYMVFPVRQHKIHYQRRVLQRIHVDRYRCGNGDRISSGRRGYPAVRDGDGALKPSYHHPCLPVGSSTIYPGIYYPCRYFRE